MYVPISIQTQQTMQRLLKVQRLFPYKGRGQSGSALRRCCKGFTDIADQAHKYAGPTMEQHFDVSKALITLIYGFRLGAAIEKELPEVGSPLMAAPEQQAKNLHFAGGTRDSGPQ